MARIALVTGGLSGIGLEVSRQLVAAGRRVAAIYCTERTEVATRRAELGVLALKCDVGDLAQCETAVKAVEQELGPVDILVNNAGITSDAMLHKMTAEQWSEVLRIDLTGVFNMTRQVIGGMRERGFGRIVNVSSINAQKGQFGQTNYCAAKAGVIGFTRALALESASRGVTVNAVAPGYTDTAMVAAVRPDILQQIKAAIPVGRLAQAAEIARCVAFLAAEEQAFITGAVLSANGGQYMAS